MSCKAITIGENATAFICKLDSNECSKGGECDSDGEPVLFGSDGNVYNQSDCPLDRELADKWHREKGINGGACSCSKCGKPFTPPMF